MIKTILVGASVFVLIFAAGIFITWQPDFSKWDAEDRAALAWVSILLSVFIAGAYEINRKP